MPREFPKLWICCKCFQENKTVQLSGAQLLDITGAYIAACILRFSFRGPGSEKSLVKLGLGSVTGCLGMLRLTAFRLHPQEFKKMAQ